MEKAEEDRLERLAQHGVDRWCDLPANVRCRILPSYSAVTLHYARLRKYYRAQLRDGASTFSSETDVPVNEDQDPVADQEPSLDDFPSQVASDGDVLTAAAVGSFPLDCICEN